MYPLNDLVPWAVAGAAAMALAAVTYLAGVYRGRRRARTGTPPAPKKAGERTDRGDLLAAAIATAVAADGMWVTFADLGMPVPLRVLTFVFLELAVVQSARRARRAMLESYSAGVDGIAMWVLTCVSAVLSASHEVMSDTPNAAVVLVRLVAPLVAAWGWERSMALERRLRGLRTSGITWRITPARVAVRLGLAEVGDRTTDQVDAHRRLVRVARAADRARTLRETNAAGWRQRRALRQAKRAMDEANEYAKLANSPELQAALLEQIGAIYNTSAFVAMDARPWWATAADDTGPADSDPPESGPERPVRRADELMLQLAADRAERTAREALQSASRTYVPLRSVEPCGPDLGPESGPVDVPDAGPDEAPVRSDVGSGPVEQEPARTEPADRTAESGPDLPDRTTSPVPDRALALAPSSKVAPTFAQELEQLPLEHVVVEDDAPPPARKAPRPRQAKPASAPARPKTKPGDEELLALLDREFTDVAPGEVTVGMVRRATKVRYERAVRLHGAWVERRSGPGGDGQSGPVEEADRTADGDGSVRKADRGLESVPA